MLLPASCCLRGELAALVEQHLPPKKRNGPIEVRSVKQLFNLAEPASNKVRKSHNYPQINTFAFSALLIPHRCLPHLTQIVEDLETKQMSPGELPPGPFAVPKDKPGHATGPRTLTGKTKSSKNRLTHGCRSEMAVLPSEDPAEYEATIQHWFDHYHPEANDEVTLVEEVALAHWHFQRATKRLRDVESHLPGNAWNWTDDNQKLFNNFTRYKTTAERSFIRWYHEIEACRGRQVRAEHARETLLKRTNAVELAWIQQKDEQGIEKDLKLEQVVRIYQDDTNTYAPFFYPTNQEILDDLSKKSWKPLLVERLLQFPRGVPPDYHWTEPNAMQKTERCAAIQRLRFADWLAATEREKITGRPGAVEFLTNDPSTAEPLEFKLQC